MTQVIVSLRDDDGVLLEERSFDVKKKHAYRAIGEIMVWLDVKLNYRHSL